MEMLAAVGWGVAALLAWSLWLAWGREADLRERLRDREGRLRLSYPTARLPTMDGDEGYADYKEWTGQNGWPKVY